MTEKQSKQKQQDQVVDTSPEATVPNVSPDDGHQLNAQRNRDDELSFVPDQNTVVTDRAAVLDNAIDNSHVDTAAERTDQ